MPPEKPTMKNVQSVFLLSCLGMTCLIAAAQPPSGNPSILEDSGRAKPEILTPPPPRVPAIHGPKIFGVRPGSAVLFSIPATGDRPISFSAHGLPHGVNLDRLTGLLTGTIKRAGSYRTKLYAHNHLKSEERRVGKECRSRLMPEHSKKK